MRYKDKFGNIANQNPFKKVKMRKRFPNFKTYSRFGMDKKFANKYCINPDVREIIGNIYENPTLVQ